MSSLEFHSLPLAEVAIRLVPSGLLAVGYREIVALADALRHVLPEVDQAPGFEVSPGLVPWATWRVPAPPPCFADAGRGLRLVIQGDLVMLRWGGVPGAAGAAYPRWKVLLETLHASTAALDAALQGRMTPFEVANLSYVNWIGTTATSARDILGRYFTPAAWPSLLPGDAPLHFVSMSWAQQGVDRRLAIERGAIRTESGEEPGYSIQHVAGSRFEPGPATAAPLTLLHDVLNDGFREILSDRAREEWALVEPT